jgi:hypothetical protein
VRGSGADLEHRTVKSRAAETARHTCE